MLESWLDEMSSRLSRGEDMASLCESDSVGLDGSRSYQIYFIWILLDGKRNYTYSI